MDLTKFPFNFTNTPFDKTACLQRVETAAQLDPAFRNSTAFASPFSNNTVDLTPQACRLICGNGWSRYDDCATRIFDWIWPVLVLVASIDRSPLRDSWPLLRAICVIGNPVGTMRHLMLIVYHYRNCKENALQLLGLQNYHRLSDYNKLKTKAVAIILAARIELEGLRLEAARKYLYDFLERAQNGPNSRLEPLLLRTAATLHLTRTRQQAPFIWKFTVPVLLSAVAWPIWLAVADIVRGIASASQKSPVSGTKIAGTFVFSWLFPMVLLSREMGSYHSLWVVRISLEHMMQEISGEVSQFSPVLRKVNRTSWKLKFEPNYTKTSIAESNPLRPGRNCLLGSIYLWISPYIPFVIAIIATLLGIAAPPTFWNTRSFLFVAIFISWTISDCITLLLGARIGTLGIVAKDISVAALLVGFLFASTCGFLNNCNTWSRSWWKSFVRELVPLKSESEFQKNVTAFFPALTYTLLVCHLTFYLVARYYYGRGGFDMLNWTEEDLNTVFIQETSDDSASCPRLPVSSSTHSIYPASQPTATKTGYNARETDV